ncbi:hypothetical protein FJ977_34125 [Mesorhizobium sp. B2-1-3A]|nr:hypothetical protein FJ977_34125 [Mesorhizobium sp. B2-1-3A]
MMAIRQSAGSFDSAKPSGRVSVSPLSFALVRVAKPVMIGLIGLSALTCAQNAFAAECAGGQDNGNDTSLACGNSSEAGASLTAGAHSTAVGPAAGSEGNNSTAVGSRAISTIDGVAVGANARSGVGLQFDSTTTSIGNTAVGSNAQAGATAPGTNYATALGFNAHANANSATAIGTGASADFANSTAINATASRENQIAIGNNTSTYTMQGINSAANKEAQAGTTYLMTSDSAGNLATSTFDLDTLENLPGQVAQNSTAISNLNTTVNNHTTQINANTTQISANTAELADHETRITNNTNAIAVHTVQIADLDSRVTSNTTNITELNGRVGALESSFQDIGNQISENRTEARAGTALALATAGLRYDDRPGKLSLAGGFGNFKGQSGLALGLGYNPSLDFRLNGAISATTNHGDVGVSLGASWTLN